jgi:hypothetical protein
MRGIQVVYGEKKVSVLIRCSKGELVESREIREGGN